MKKQYDSYKDSGVEWIGKIPSHWEVLPLKRCAKIKTGSTPSTKENKYYDSEDINWFTPGDIVGGPIIEAEKKISKIAFLDGACRIFPANSIYFVGIGSIGKVAYCEIEASANQQINVIMPYSRANYKFLTYFLKSQEQLLVFSANSVTLPIINQERMGLLLISLPPKSEQINISSYLDRKCGEIDKAIATQEKRIELLKELRQNIITQAVTRGINPDAPLKDPGVEWIGEVPEHWKVMKMNHALRSISDVNHYMPDSVSEGYPYIMTGDLKEFLSEIDLDSCKQISVDDYKELTVKSKAQKGDVIFARYATIGTVCYVDVDKDFVVSYSCVTIKPNSSILDGLFLFYYLQTHTFFEDVSQSINSNTQGNVGIESLSASRLIVPPISEQQEIVTYIETKTARLDASIEKAEHQIELLQELKQSIITEVVTGKRKVV